MNNVGLTRSFLWGLAPVVALLFLLVAWHAEASAVTVSVSRFVLTVNEGDRNALRFTIVNDEAASLEITCVPVAWDDSVEGRTVIAPEDRIERSCATWLTVSPERVLLEPFGETEVKVSLNVPYGVRGSYWGGLLLRVRAAAAENGEIASEGLAVHRELLIRVYATALPAEAAAEIGGMIVDSDRSLSARVLFVNTGQTVLFGIAGILTVENPSGTLRLEQPIPAFEALPGHAVWIEIVTPWVLGETDRYLVRAVFDYGADHLVAGQVIFHVGGAPPEVSYAAPSSRPYFPSECGRIVLGR